LQGGRPFKKSEKITNGENMKKNHEFLGWGFAPKKVFTDENLSIGAKALFGLLSSFQGNKQTSWAPSSLLMAYLGISKDSFFKYLKELTEKEYFEVEKHRKAGKFDNNIYRINMNSLINLNFSVDTNEEFTASEKNRDGKKPRRLISDTNNNKSLIITEFKDKHELIPSEEKNSRLEAHEALNVQSSHEAIENPAKATQTPNSACHEPSADAIFTAWNEAGVITHKSMTDKTAKAIKSALKNSSEAEIIDAIKNYGHVIKDPGAFFKYKWILSDFLSRGLEKFKTEADPLKNFRKTGARPDRSGGYRENGGAF
jgi:hypothetical protein